jgi:hypothetical protein
MKKVIIIALAVTGILLSCKKSNSGLDVTNPQTPTDSLGHLLKNSCQMFTGMRNSKGIYIKAYKFDGTADNNPSSVAVVGMGLTSLCIANAMGWNPGAKAEAVTTLKSMLGQTAGFTPPRNAAGFFPHYINMTTGANTGANGVSGSTSEYATIDNAVFISGVLFCKKYFNDPQVDTLANQLWNSMDWTKAVAQASTGKVYLQLDEQGNCGIGANGNCNTAKPYNEYILVCWLAYNKEQQNGVLNGPATQLWNQFYADPTNLPHSTYSGTEVKVAVPGDFIAEHVYQMPYFYCHAFSSDQKYLNIQTNARLTDMAWSRDFMGSNVYEWGLSAGSSYTGGVNDGYKVNAVNDNPDRYVSPHTIAGYLPTYPQGKTHLLKLWKNNLGVFNLAGDTTKKVLWRYSQQYPQWKARYAQGVDFATFMLGLASLPEFLGTSFFNSNNNFFN